MRHRISRALTVAMLGSATLAAAVASSSANEITVRVMTRNMYQGTSFQEVIAATTPAEFVAAVTTVYQNVIATKPMERAIAVAREIAQERPDLVGLQEADILRTAASSPGAPAPVPATDVVSDQLRFLLNELDRRGHHYEAIAIVPGVDPQAPSTLPLNVRNTYRTVIIARKDNFESDIKLSNMQVQHYLVNKVFPTAAGVPFINTRGWASVDVTMHGQTFRFVTTHLEAEVPFSTQQAQAYELLKSTGNTDLPIVYVADFNIFADASADPTYPTYQLLIGSGLTDAWQAKHSSLPGFTCCQAPDVANPVSTLSHRIDLVLYRGDVSVEDITIIGDSTYDKTPSGLWPSDHAGVVATLRIGRHGNPHH